MALPLAIGLMCTLNVAWARAGVGCFHARQTNEVPPGTDPGGASTATACLDQSNGETYYGGYVEFHDLGLRVSNANHHTNAVMWFYTVAPVLDPSGVYYSKRWVEMGLRNGSGGSSGINTGYKRYWAEFDSSGNEHLHLFPASPTNGNHAYEIQRNAATAKWDVFFDFNLVGTSAYQPINWVGYQVQIGVEDSFNPVDTSASTDKFDFNPMQAKNSAGGWYNFNYHRDHIMYPCNYYGVTPYWPPGQCFYWGPISNYEILIAKP